MSSTISVRRLVSTACFTLSTAFALAATGDLLQTIPNPTPAADDFFGTDIAVAGSSVAVSATGHDTNSANAGAVYFFSSKTGELAGTFQNPATDANTSFGQSLAASGKNVVIGEPLADSNGIDSGFAWVVRAPGPQISRTFQNPAVPTVQDGFGFEVAALKNTIAISSPFEDLNTTNGGAVYLYGKSTAGTTSTSNILLPSANGQNLEFGRSIGFAGNALLIGAPGDFVGMQRAGRVYVANLKQSFATTVLQPTNPTSGTRFGEAVSGDRRVALVGAPETAGGDGAAYLFSLPGGDLITQIQSPVAAGAFGRAVLATGSYYIVGAPLANTGANQSGAVYVYDNTGSLLLTIPNPDPAPGAQFGSSLAAGKKALYIGAPGAPSGGSLNSGAVYMFELGKL